MFVSVTCPNCQHKNKYSFIKFKQDFRILSVNGFYDTTNDGLECKKCKYDIRFKKTVTVKIEDITVIDFKGAKCSSKDVIF